MQKVTDTYILSCLLQKARETSFSCVLLSNKFEDAYGRWQYFAGFGIAQVTEDLSSVDRSADSPWFGYVSYDYKNSIEQSLSSQHASLCGFASLKFVLPEIWVGLDRNGQVHGTAEGLSLWEQIQTAENDVAQYAEMDAIVQPSVTWSPLTSRETYLNSVAKIQAGIVEGDYYEMNHCVAFTATAEIDPYITFLKLNGKAPAPFACFLKDGDQFLLSASPERFIAQKGKELVSQPIKGTRKRQLAEDQAQADTEAVASLKESEKDRAENIMIVDLVRNDMSRVCNSGSVHVPALCEVYTYSHVHQMISTVKGTLKEGANVKEILHATFPMGSMTGAPKIAVMQATEGLENFSRGIYSGAVGYVWKDTMDLNVVIRSLMYDASKQQLSYAVGGAITIDSVATEEYQECLDKAATVLSIFG